MKPARKLTAEDLFGDILGDLDGPGPEPVLAEPGEHPQEKPEAVLEVFGNYDLLTRIAAGGMAELFRARPRGGDPPQKVVAIKRILPHLSTNVEFIRMFINEAKVATQLGHPNIAQVFDLGKANGLYYIAMELVHGKDLRSVLRKIKEFSLPMPEVLAATVIAKIANALDYAHRKRAINDRELRLVHRDISPQNIVVSYAGEVKLVDFGIAKAANRSNMTQAGALKGKLLYMSPEQALGLPLDSRSDLYSLGLVLAELLTGVRCFHADSDLGVLEKVRLGKVIDIRAANPALSEEILLILDRVLQREPGHRFPSGRLFERALKELLAARRCVPTELDLALYLTTMLSASRDEARTFVRERYSEARSDRPA